MIRRVTLVMALVGLAFAVVAAGEMQKGTTQKMSMEDMKAGMMKCYVCKNIAAHMDEFGPMGMETTKLNDGLAVRHWVQSPDPKKVAAFHTACQAAQQAGQECMSFSDERAQTDLCQYCQGIRSAAKAGARVSQGETPNGDIMVLTSSDPSVQMQLTALEQKCAMMAATIDQPMGTSPRASKN